ncbi:MAG TPA: ribbon-helix-helix domain-containing protein [Stellaceae bacterium]|nr:ribbon-helix-helix domain-containing protein [Stellaceae bacterium]
MPINDIIIRHGQQSLRLLLAEQLPAKFPCRGRSLRIGGRTASRLSRRPVQPTRASRSLENSPPDADRDAMQGSAIVKRSVRIAGHATSISLEAAFWDALREIAAFRQVPVPALVAAIDAGRSGNLSSAIRLFVLDGARRGELTGGAPNARVDASF